MKTKLLAFTALFGFLCALILISGCKKKEPGTTKIESISFKEANYTIAENNIEFDLKGELVADPVGILDTAVIKWAVDNEEMAEMSGSIIIPKGHGEVNVTATIQDKFATCHIIITEKAIEGITLSDTELTSGETVTMNCVTDPENIPLSRFRWESDNEDIVIVNNGIMRGKRPGTTTVRAVYGDIKSSASVTVNPVYVESVTLNPNVPECFKKIGDRIVFNATVSPKNASYPDVVWKSSNTSVAKIIPNQFGNNHTVCAECVGEGSSTITATTSNGKSASCVVSFKSIPVTRINLSEESHLFEKVSDYFFLKATVEPSNASDKVVTWKSSNTNVATVKSYGDDTGIVTCLDRGTATITATCGSISATCEVTTYATGTVKDCRNNTYNTIKIGSQWWMAENLRCDKYDTGSPRAGNTVGSYGYIDARLKGNWSSDEYTRNLSYAQQQKLGFVYTWDAAIGARNSTEVPSSKQGICPSGWHLPSLSEWNTLCKTVCGSTLDDQSNYAARELRTVTGWYWNNVYSTDSFKFSALPSGVINIYKDNPIYKVVNVGRAAFYWTSDIQGTSVWNINIGAVGTLFKGNTEYGREDFMAVRCVKN